MPEPTPSPERAKPPRDRGTRRAIHGPILAGVAYANALAPRLASMLPDGVADPVEAAAHLADVLERMKPRDPLEEMLIVQAAVTHLRVLHLNSLANRQEELPSVRVCHEHADKASNVYRRQMLALAEYRRPPRPGDSFTAIKQANIAGQQVVMNSEDPAKENATTEQGCPHHADARHAPHAPTPLPPEPRGAGGPASLGDRHEAVGAIHRPADARGEGPIPLERLEARRAVRRGDGAAG